MLSEVRKSAEISSSWFLAVLDLQQVIHKNQPNNFFFEIRDQQPTDRPTEPPTNRVTDLNLPTHTPSNQPTD